MKALTFLSIFASFCSQASLINFGSADNYLMAAGGHNSIILGSSAHLMGNVAAGYYLNIGSGAIIEGNACAPALGIGAGVRIDGIQNCSVPELQVDIKNASVQLANMLMQPKFDISTPMTLNAGTYQIGSLLLDAGETLTLHGNASDTVVINITGPAKLGSGSGINLTGGLKPSNVYFNFISSARYNSFEFGGASLLGTFVSDGRTFVMGDGATLNNTRFLTNGSILANVQTVNYMPQPDISPLPDDEMSNIGNVNAPSLLIIALCSFLGLSFFRKTNA